jgi:hypothetical protein
MIWWLRRLKDHFAPSALRSFNRFPPGPMAQAITFRAFGAEPIFFTQWFDGAVSTMRVIIPRKQ